MATVYSGEVAIGTYNRIRIKCDYSGTSATLTVQFSRTSTWTDTWADSAATLNFNGQNKPAAYNYYGTVGSSWVDLVSVGGYTISTSGGNYSWTFNNPGGGSVLGCSGTIAIPAQSTAPTDLTISNPRPGIESLTATVSVTSWGGAGDATTRYRNLSVFEHGSTTVRRTLRVYGDNLSGDITVDNSCSGSLSWITGNTQYDMYASAANGTYSSTTGYTPFVTLPYAPVIFIDSKTTTSATLGYTISADGGYYNKTLEYSLDNGTTWTTAATITGGTAQSGTFTITGLTPSTSYTLKTRVQTTAGTTDNTDLTFTTSAPNPQVRLYGSVSGDATRVASLYGSVNSQSAFIVKLYGPEQVTTLTYTVTDIANNTGFDSTTFMSKYNAEYGDMTKEPTQLSVWQHPNDNSWSADLIFADSSRQQLFWWTPIEYLDEGVAWGFASGVVPASGAVTSTSTTQTSYQTKRIF